MAPWAGILTKYQKRASGPMLDRKVPRVDYEKLSSDRLGESSASIRERVQAARERQRVRFEGTDIVCPVQEPGLPQFRHARGGSSQIL